MLLLYERKHHLSVSVSEIQNYELDNKLYSTLKANILNFLFILVH